MNKDSKQIRYAFYADNCNGTVIIQNLMQGNYFMGSVKQILADENITSSLPPEHLAHLKTIIASDT